MRSIILLPIAAVFILFSCKNDQPEKNEKQTTVIEKPNYLELETGIIHQHLKTKTDTNLTYSVYLPTSYTTNNFLPVVIFFDAHARNVLPLETYQSLAEKYKFILVSSEQSKNGQEWKYSATLGDKLINEVTSSFAIDKNQMITSGFSGGARVATGLAMSRFDIKGVIASAAAFPGEVEATNSRFNFLGVIGNKDMNYLEMKSIDKQLDNSGVNHFILEYDGEHDWPPIDVMNEAFLYHFMESIRLKERTTEDTEIINHFISQQTEQTKTYLSEANYYKAGLAYHKLVEFTQYFADTSLFENEVKAVANNKKVLEAAKLNEMYLQQESDIQIEYNNDFGRKEIIWWEKEVKRLRGKVKTAPNMESNMYQRILNYISLVSNLQATQLMEKNDLKSSAYFLDLYKMVDPDNPDVYYLSAIYFSKIGQKANALNFLRKAVELGYEDFERMENQQAFVPYHDDPMFKSLFPNKPQ